MEPWCSLPSSHKLHFLTTGLETVSPDSLCDIPQYLQCHDHSPTCTLAYTPSSSPVQGVWTLINRTQAAVFMSDILLQLTANASQDVFLNLFPSSETKFFRFSWQLLKWGWSFAFARPVVLCLMSHQYPCELLQTMKMEAVHPSQVSEHRKKSLHNVEPQKTTVTLQINLHVWDH